MLEVLAEVEAGRSSTVDAVAVIGGPGVEAGRSSAVDAVVAIGCPAMDQRWVDHRTRTNVKLIHIDILIQ